MSADRVQDKPGMRYQGLQDIGKIPHRYVIDGKEQLMHFSQVDVAVMQSYIDGMSNWEIFELLGNRMPIGTKKVTKDEVSGNTMKHQRVMTGRARGVSGPRFDGFRRAIIFAARWGIVEISALPAEPVEAVSRDEMRLVGFLGFGVADGEIRRRMGIDQSLFEEYMAQLPEKFGLVNEYQLVAVSARSLGYPITTRNV